MPQKREKEIDKQNFEHRGRVQAQGEKLEKSETWTQNNPPTKNEGVQIVEKLKNKISKEETKKREKQFEEAKKFINRAPKDGVCAPVSKTFLVKNTDHERVDLEVIRGIAFIDDYK